MSHNFTLRAVDAAGRTLRQQSIDFESAIIIGRASDAGFQVAESAVSGKHVQIKFKDGQFHLRDLASQNGVYFGGKKVETFSATAPFTFKLGHAIIVTVSVTPTTDNIHRGLQLWDRASALSAREICLGFLGGCLIYSLNFVFIRHNSILYALSLSLMILGCAALVMGLLAAFWGFVGWLIRGNFHARPLFVVSVTVAAVIANTNLFVPLAFVSPIGLLFKLILPLANGFACTVMIFIWSITVFPKRWAKGLTIVAGLLGSGLMFFYWQANIEPGRSGVMKTVFEEDPYANVYRLERKIVEAQQLGADFQALEREFNRQPAGNPK